MYYQILKDIPAGLCLPGFFLPHSRFIHSKFTLGKKPFRGGKNRRPVFQKMAKILLQRQ